MLHKAMPKKSRYGWLIALGLVMAMVIGPAIFIHDREDTVVVDAGGCETWIAGWVSVPSDCHPKQLPGAIRSCLFAIIGSGLFAWLTEGTGTSAAVGGAAIGCGANTLQN